MSTFSASLLRLKLLDALRSGDTHKVDSVLNELQSTPHTTQTQDVSVLKETVLHYAVQVAPASILAYLITNASKFNIDLNSQDADGNTPLHLAAAASRGDVVKYLLALPNINDTIVNKSKQQPVELCRDPNIAQLMQFERAKFVEKSSIQLRQFFSNRDFDSLEGLLVHNPRASELLDINGADPDTGNTVLHEFIKKDDYEMCEWLLKHGGDPFKRDKRGKLPIDLISNKKDDQLKKLLKSASRNSNLMDPVINTNNAIKAGNSPTYKGYLRKWTNFASGYKLRYFLLDSNGILSYYTNQDDTNNACRGSLNLSFAYLHLDSSEKLKFEIIGKNGIRWHLKANHPVETNRWVWTLQNAITISKDNLKRLRHEEKSNVAAGAKSSTPGPTSNPNASNLTVNTSGNTGSAGPQSPSAALSPNDASFTGRPSTDDQASTSSGRRLFHIPGRRSSKHKRNSSQTSVSSVGSENGNSNFEKANTPTPLSPNLNKIREGLPDASKSDIQSTLTNESDAENFYYESDGDFESEDEDEDSYEPGSESSNLAFENLSNQVSTLKGSLDVGITSLLELFQKIEKSPSSNDSNDEIYKVASLTLKTIHESFKSYNTLIESRDAKLMRKLDRQLEINKLWENSIHQLEDEISKREDKLAEYQGQKKQLKKYITEGNISVGPVNVGTTGIGKGGVIGLGHGETSKNLESNEKEVLDEILEDSDDDEFFDADEEKDLLSTEQNNDVQIMQTVEEGKEKEKKDSGDPPPYTPATIATDKETDTDSDVDPKKDMDFSEKTHTKSQEDKLTRIMDEGSFLGYEKPFRTKLAMDEDNRPKVGLWGILKSMIGKDMTKMTLPVSFNECTSLLQRLAEDIEYSSLLDTAAQSDDSTLRMVYVAAFGASEYASTINRIAKPFNPLLGETFEYCRPDQKYRLIVEQVSHHPPISACSAESVSWDYYGENAVDSQFRGRSFDFKHLGKMFCVVRPNNGVIDKHGNKVEEELYSWKKVNTSVVGIIVGNPTVDNFGKMEVTNHTTGDKLILDLKQRGWRASSAYQLSGHVTDAKGKTHWAIGGHWNSKIFAKKVTETPSSDRRDSLIETSDSAASKLSSDPYSGNKFLVWQAAPRPKVPFNLTQFAITLNDDNDNLKPWLAPSDTRLRPDQRAMENGDYDLASSEKHRVEEKQRAAKKQREAKGVAYKPNWFVKRKHPVTGDAYWEFSGEYWKQRKEKNLEKSADIF
ncbi:oxysterol-binding protein homolog 1 [[Candida] railenensis]|uniref:Oxysterol-binding protein homolog 1 n=1 Tax=[Candida] railenensis TaxID=45579 RepID=A0A9P0QM71_9ASCO|nr:oxysterol-binding protein homolog 1 [[Candida] railenensis]